MLVVLVSVVALTSTLTTALAAPALKEEFEATMQVTGWTPPKRLWIDEESACLNLPFGFGQVL